MNQSELEFPTSSCHRIFDCVKVLNGPDLNLIILNKLFEEFLNITFEENCFKNIFF